MIATGSPIEGLSLGGRKTTSYLIFVILCLGLVEWWLHLLS